MPGREPLPNWDQYATRWTALHGGVDPRRGRPSVGHWLRFGYVLAKGCARARIRPSLITLSGLLACLLVPAFVGPGHGTGGRLLAAMLVLFAAVADTVDGALAVVTSHATKLGYVYDSMVDRIGEACWLLALWRIGVPGYLVLLAGALSWLHEYTRARANAAGMREIGASTLGERPTRVILAFLGIGLAGLVGLGSKALPSGVATFMVAVWSVLALIGFMQLFASIHKALAGRVWPMWQPPSPPPPTTTTSIDDEFARLSSMPPTTTIYTSQAALPAAPDPAPDPDPAALS
jgi:phosphatidylglycerophosphate synthase